MAVFDAVVYDDNVFDCGTTPPPPTIESRGFIAYVGVRRFAAECNPRYEAEAGVRRLSTPARIVFHANAGQRRFGVSEDDV